MTNMAAPLTYTRFCALNAKSLNFIAPFKNSRVFLRFRSDKAAEDPVFVDDEFDERLSEEEIDKIRNVSNMPEWQYNKYKGRMNFDLSEVSSERLKSRTNLRKMYVRYGAASGINPSIMWPSKTELEELIRDEQEWQPSFQQLVQKAKEKQQLEQQEIVKRQEKIASQMSKMDTWIKDYKKKQEKALAAETVQVSDRRQKLIEEAEEYYGYQIESSGPKFREFMTMKMEADRLKKKQEKKEQKKKEKEDMGKLIMQRAQAKKEKDAKVKETKKKADSDDED